MGCAGVLDILEKKKIVLSCRDSKPGRPNRENDQATKQPRLVSFF